MTPSDSSATVKRKAVTSLLWLCFWTAVLLGLLVFLFYPAFSPGHSKESARKTQDLALLKQVGNALSLYFQDSDNRFPPEMSSVRGAFKSIQGYFTGYSRDPFEVPQAAVRESREFLGNGSLARKKQTEISEPRQVMVFFNSAPHAQKVRAVLFADISAKAVSEDGFQRAIANGWRHVPKEEGP